MRTFVLKALKQKKVVALVVAATVFSSVYAFAATLGVNPNSLGAGNATVTSCTGASSITTSYAIAYDSTISGGGYKVSSVTVSGIPAACSTKSLVLDLVNTSNATIASVPAHTLVAADVTGGTPGTYTYTFASGPNAALVTSVSAVISG